MYAWLLVITLFVVGALVACTYLLRADKLRSMAGGLLLFAVVLALTMLLTS